MSTHYEPACPACRTLDPSTFYSSCGGCQARKAHAEALRRAAAQLTKSQFDGMDDMLPPEPAEERSIEP